MFDFKEVLLEDFRLSGVVPDVIGRLDIVFEEKGKPSSIFVARNSDMSWKPELLSKTHNLKNKNY